MLKEFRAFIIRGNVLDLAVAIIIGAAFVAVVNSLVGDLIMPVVSLVTGKIDFKNLYIPLAGQASNLDLETAKKAGAVFSYGSFLTALINFLIIAFVVFLIVRAVNNMMNRNKKEAVAEPPKAPAPTLDQTLLMEIRDALKAQNRQ
jgi:large conductance mechanosensitive channel